MVPQQQRAAGHRNRALDLPMTPEKVWRALASAK